MEIFSETDVKTLKSLQYKSNAWEAQSILEDFAIQIESAESFEEIKNLIDETEIKIRDLYIVATRMEIGFRIVGLISLNTICSRKRKKIIVKKGSRITESMIPTMQELDDSDPNVTKGVFVEDILMDIYKVQEVMTNQLARLRKINNLLKPPVDRESKKRNERFNQALQSFTEEADPHNSPPNNTNRKKEAEYNYTPHKTQKKKEAEYDRTPHNADRKKENDLEITPFPMVLNGTY